MNNLAATLAGLGDFAEAESLAVRAQLIIEKTFGTDHLLVADGLENLAELYEGMGRKAETQGLRERAEQIRSHGSKGSEIRTSEG